MVILWRKSGLGLHGDSPSMTTRTNWRSLRRHSGILAWTRSSCRPRAVLSLISRAKKSKKTPQDMYQEATEPNLTKIAVIFEEYEKALRQANALDFDDLLLETVRLLDHDEAHARLQPAARNTS